MRENYLLHRARQILIELEQEYQRICQIETTYITDEKNYFLHEIKIRMIEVENGIEALEKN